jgi:hypothetical protein
VNLVAKSEQMSNYRKLKENVDESDPIKAEIDIFSKKREQATEVESLFKMIRQNYNNARIKELKSTLSTLIEPQNQIFMGENCDKYFKRLREDWSHKIFNSEEYLEDNFVHKLDIQYVVSLLQEQGSGQDSNNENFKMNFERIVMRRPKIDLRGDQIELSDRRDHVSSDRTPREIPLKPVNDYVRERTKGLYDSAEFGDFKVEKENISEEKMTRTPKYDNIEIHKPNLAANAPGQGRVQSKETLTTNESQRTSKGTGVERMSNVRDSSPGRVRQSCGCYAGGQTGHVYISNCQPHYCSVCESSGNMASGHSMSERTYVAGETIVMPKKTIIVRENSKSKIKTEYMKTSNGHLKLDSDRGHQPEVVKSRDLTPIGQQTSNVNYITRPTESNEPQPELPKTSKPKAQSQDKLLHSFGPISQTQQSSDTVGQGQRYISVQLKFFQEQR